MGSGTWTFRRLASVLGSRPQGSRFMLCIHMVKHAVWRLKEAVRRLMRPLCSALGWRLRFLKEVAWCLMTPFCSALAFLWFKDFWGVREALGGRPEAHPILARVYSRHLSRCAAWIGPGASFQGRPIFPHDIFGVFISNYATIGKNCVILPHVAIAANPQSDSKFRGSPIVGDNVFLGLGAKVVGGVRVGHNCRIGANATICTNLPDNTLAVCAPTRTIRVSSGFDNAFDPRWHDGL